jgi:predicted DNA-binding transcriptional regulator AlpA
MPPPKMPNATPRADEGGAQGATSPAITLLTPEEAAKLLRLSLSWLAKARMRGDGPPYILIGRSIRYREDAIIQWMKGRERLSTNEK